MLVILFIGNLTAFVSKALMMYLADECRSIDASIG